MHAELGHLDTPGIVQQSKFVIKYEEEREREGGGERGTREMHTSIESEVSIPIKC